MLHQLHAAWRARRVLLVSNADVLTLFMQSLLTELGARPARIPPTADSETLARALTDGRIGCIIVPNLCALSTGDFPAQLAALDTLLAEAREAGVPLVMLLCGESVYRATDRPWYARESDPIGGETREGLFSSLLQLYADGVSRALLGDAVSVQIIRHLPPLGSGHPAAQIYAHWCRAILSAQPLDVPNPGAQGVFLHPLDVCAGSLLLGARFFGGDRAITGAFNLGVGPQNLMPLRTAALRLCAQLHHERPIHELPARSAIPMPLPDGTRARLLCGACTLIPGDEALLQLHALMRAAQSEAQTQVIREQTLDYLARMNA